MGYANYYGGMNLIWWIVWLVMIFWIFATPYDIPGQRRRKESPLDILQKRFAEGAINSKEYEEKKAILQSELPVQDRL
jgi:putative membrane protein